MPQIYFHVMLYETKGGLHPTATMRHDVCAPVHGGGEAESA